MSNNPPKSLEALIHKIIDYAGLFPPASLSLNDAFENYIKYCSSEYNWMLSNFIIPAAKLDELTKLIKKSNYPGILDFSVLGTGGKTESEFNKTLETDLEAWKKFLESNAGKAKTNIYEVKLPGTLILSQDSKEIGNYIESISNKIEDRIDKEIPLFFEGMTSGDDWEENIDAVIEGIKIHNMNYTNTGFKLRTGGTEKSAFPLPERVGFAIRECLNRQVAMKCTAGLHHPIRHFKDEVNCRMHGFLNIFGAGAIAIRHNISEYEMILMLEEEDPSAFIFTDEYFSWDKYKVSIDDIKYSREALTVSFGSCSFDEPIEDLQKLKLL